MFKKLFPFIIGFILFISFDSVLAAKMEASDPVLINKLRDRLVDEMTTHSSLYDDIDLERVKTNDWSVQRFLQLSKADVDNGFTMAREALRWRKSYGINNLTDLSFPKEFYKIGAMFSYLEDRKGQPVIYLRVKLYKNFGKFSEHMKQFFFYIINKIDLQTQEKGFAMIWDLTGAGPSNWDLPLIKTVVTLIRTHFPGGLNYLIPFGIPWIMTPLVNLVIQFLPEESRRKVHIINRDQIFDYIEPTKVPDFMSGLSTESYKIIPEGVRDLREMAHEYGLTNHEVQNILKYYEHEMRQT